MKYPTVFHLISNEFKKKKTLSVLIGGFAVNYYKVSRQTADVDFLITKNSFDIVVDAFKKAGYKIDIVEEHFARLKENKLYLMDIDFMFADEKTIAGIIRHGKKVSIAGQEFTVPSLTHLIALKLHYIKHNPKIREQTDLPDVINLIRMNKVNVKTKKFTDLCLKYGTQTLYNKILKSV